MPTDNNIYNPTTNPVSPYRSWLPPSHSCYASEVPNDYIYFKFSHFLKKKTKKETLEIE